MKLAGFDEAYVLNDIKPTTTPAPQQSAGAGAASRKRKAEEPLPDPGPPKKARRIKTARSRKAASATAAKEEKTPAAPEFDLKAGIVRDEVFDNTDKCAQRRGVLEDDGLLTADQVREELGPRIQWKRKTDPGYDPDLLDMIAMCLAEDPDNRPNIAELLNTLKEFVEKRDGNYYKEIELPGLERETNGYLRRLVQTYMYDASVAE
ncbi:hypothetical protein PG996_003274 [Apiospora saccharicola]|uniref:Protein kinase domain-containing protein n=1 Tax=Apiospora saccharicola TaxID=335842 RepID=A0ABR1W4L7_9PEZI